MIPPDVRAAVNRRANGACEDCGCGEPLELHHLRYWTNDERGWSVPIDGLETIHDLDALCRECHHGRHLDRNGEFWKDPEEMADHWWGFDNEMSKP